MFFIKNKKSGFTLVEALVAVSILMIAIASPMYLTQKSLSTASLAKDQMIASFLAQDAIEAVKNIRDEIAINGKENEDDDWLEETLLQPCLCDTDNSCKFDTDVTKFCTIDTTRLEWSSDAIKKGNSFDKLKLSYNLDPLTGEKTFLKYDYTGLNGEDSKYTRFINIRKNPAGDNENEALLKVRVSWDTPFGTQKVEIENFLYNFSENFE